MQLFYHCLYLVHLVCELERFYASLEVVAGETVLPEIVCEIRKKTVHGALEKQKQKKTSFSTSLHNKDK